MKYFYESYVNFKLLFLFLTIFCSCEMIQAAKWTDQGKYDISWYNDLSSSFDISTARQLAGLIYLCNNGNSFAGKTIVIKTDLDLSANDWVPINNFSGTLDGGFHEVSGLKVNHKNSTLGPNYFSFPLTTTLNGTIRNLNLKVSFELYSHGYDEIWVSGICKTNNGSIVNCIMNGTISALNDGDGVALGYLPNC